MSRPVDAAPRGRTGAAAVWAALQPYVDRHDSDASAPRLHVLDAGGGSGGLAVPLAVLGHRVTVVDPSPDSLATLARRADEAGVGERVLGRQGDLGELVDLADQIGPADLVLCHSVLEHVEDAGAGLAAVAAATRPGGRASILVASRAGTVLARVAAGRLAEARALLGPGDVDETAPAPRRFTRPGLLAMVARCGLAVDDVHGVRLLTDLAPSGLADGDPSAARLLADLEHAAATDSALDLVGAQIHVLAVRP